MEAVLHPDAEQELANQAKFYDESLLGLGERFIDEVERSIDFLLSQPLVGTRLSASFRSFVLDDFPFYLIYSIEPAAIWIIAVAHQSRQPGYWTKRISPGD